MGIYHHLSFSLLARLDGVARWVSRVALGRPAEGRPAGKFLKNKKSKCHRYSGHFWHFDFLFFENGHEASGAYWLGYKWVTEIYMTHLTWL